MSASLDQIPRTEKAAITRALHVRLGARLQKGPPEPELDDYVPQLADVARRLEVPVHDGVSDEADRARRIAAVVSADDEVDTYLRHIEGYLAVEAMRRTGANGALAKVLHDAAFPDGLAHIDDRIVEENFHCRASLAVLRTPERATTLAALELPGEWLVRWETALDASDAAIAEVLRSIAAKDSQAAGAPPHVEEDVEASWVDLMVRLRRYVANRAERDDVARIEEGRELLRPLFDALQKLRMGVGATTGPTSKRG
jgi:hypothetical protein